MAEKETKKSEIREYISSILIAVGLALVIRTGVVQAFYIPSGSMEDTLLVGDYLLANKFVYGAPIDIPGTNISLGRLPGLRDPQPGDIVIFRSPVDKERDLIKRCVAVGGQEVHVVNKVLYVDGERFGDPPLSKYTDRNYYPAAVNPRDNFGPFKVPEDHFFMMGDNRDNSYDSRYWRSVPQELIKGKAMSIYWSWASDNRGPYYRGLTSLPGVVGTYLWRLPGRVRYGRLGDVIH
ncbi:MAG: signal peptidase I [Gemmatimonadetes bacterium]|jgi:signal peptidase I|nr:signal peptidase I [Gemmatimonadota bacterium]